MYCLMLLKDQFLLFYLLSVHDGFLILASEHIIVINNLKAMHN